jgi:hypothetical protein
MGFHYLQRPREYGDRPIDLSAYSGINFWGWAHEPFPDAPLSVQVSFPNQDTHYNDPAASCWTREDQSKRCDAFYADVALTSTWTQFTVLFDDLHQSQDEWDPPQVRFDHFDKTTVYSTAFTIKGGRPDIMSQPFDFCIAHVYFTP